MALPVREQFIYWGIAMAVFMIVLWWLGDVIMPFLLGGAIAYLLDPVADRLERFGLSRAAATSVITVFAILMFTILAFAVIPTLVNQAIGLVEAAPRIISNLQRFLTERFPSIMEEGSVVRDSLISLGQTLQSRGGQLVNGVLASVGGIVNILVLMVIVPVVAFYLLLDWDNIVAKIDRLVPRDHVGTVREIARDIDKTLSGFIRGQGAVCLILGSYYSVALMLVGLPFGLVVGAIAGALTFIPYVGALVGGGLAVGLALFEFWGDWIWILVVAAIFQSGQFVEGNILTPQLVGNSVGLHPVWLIFALSAFGALFGFVGLLVAVPVAASLGVVIRYGLERYKQSLLFRGLDRSNDE